MHKCGLGRGCCGAENIAEAGAPPLEAGGWWSVGVSLAPRRFVGAEAGAALLALAAQPAVADSAEATSAVSEALAFV